MSFYNTKKSLFECKILPSGLVDESAEAVTFAVSRKTAMMIVINKVFMVSLFDNGDTTTSAQSVKHKSNQFSLSIYKLAFKLWTKEFDDKQGNKH